jgi:hypothetical protein
MSYINFTAFHHGKKCNWNCVPGYAPRFGIQNKTQQSIKKFTRILDIHIFMYICKNFKMISSRVIGLGGPNAWYPHFPSLMPTDFSSWGFVTAIFAKRCKCPKENNYKKTDQMSAASLLKTTMKCSSH